MKTAVRVLAVALVAAACACDAPVLAQTTAGSPASARAPASPNDAVVSYLAAWNERDPARRRAQVARAWTESGTYIDAHRHGEGHAAIDAMIGAAQERFPGYELHLVSGIEAHDGYVRFKWAAGGTPGAPLYLAGTDFLTLSGDGRIQSVVGFVDAAPAAR